MDPLPIRLSAAAEAFPAAATASDVWLVSAATVFHVADGACVTAHRLPDPVAVAAPSAADPTALLVLLTTGDVHRLVAPPPPAGGLFADSDARPQIRVCLPDQRIATASPDGVVALVEVPHLAPSIVAVTAAGAVLRLHATRAPEALTSLDALAVRAITAVHVLCPTDSAIYRAWAPPSAALLDVPLLVVGTADGIVAVAPLQTGGDPPRIVARLYDPVAAIACGGHILAAVSAGGVLVLCDAATESPQRTQLRRLVRGLALSRDGATIVLLDTDGRLLYGASQSPATLESAPIVPRGVALTRVPASSRFLVAMQDRVVFWQPPAPSLATAQNDGTHAQHSIRRSLVAIEQIAAQQHQCQALVTSRMDKLAALAVALRVPAGDQPSVTITQDASAAPFPISARVPARQHWFAVLLLRSPATGSIVAGASAPGAVVRCIPPLGESALLAEVYHVFHLLAAGSAVPPSKSAYVQTRQQRLRALLDGAGVVRRLATKNLTNAAFLSAAGHPLCSLGRQIDGVFKGHGAITLQRTVQWSLGAGASPAGLEILRQCHATVAGTTRAHLNSPSVQWLAAVHLALLALGKRPRIEGPQRRHIAQQVAVLDTRCDAIQQSLGQGAGTMALIAQLYLDLTELVPVGC